MTRRTFLQDACLGSMAVPLGVGGHTEAVASADDGTRRLRWHRVFFDARSPHGLSFGDVARQSGAPTRAISGDLGDACYGELSRGWRIARLATAGLTDFRVFSLVETMAAATGLRPLLCVAHCIAGQSVRHEVCGSNAHCTALQARLSDAANHWARTAARSVMMLDEDAAIRSYQSAKGHKADQRAFGRRGRLDSRALVTWVIA